MNNQEWIVKAKMNGDSLCPRCNEPVGKSDKGFSKRGMCRFCAKLISNDYRQNRNEQVLKHANRGDLIISVIEP